MAIGFGSGLGGFATGLESGVKVATGLANSASEDTERKARVQYLQDETDLRKKADARAQQQFDDAEQVRQQALQERQVGQDALSDFQQDTEDGTLPADTRFSDYYVKNVLPKVVSTRVANGDAAGAAALDQWGQNQQKQSLINSLGLMVNQAHQGAQTGDFQPLNGTMRDIWNNLSPQLTGGSEFRSVNASPDGTVTATFLGANKKISTQNWPNVGAFVQHIEDISHPEFAFEHERQNGLLGPLVTADAGNQSQPAGQRAPQPASVDDATAFNRAPMAATAAPLAGGAPSPTGAKTAPAIPISPDTNAGASSPAASSVQPLSAVAPGVAGAPVDQPVVTASATPPQSAPASGPVQQDVYAGGAAVPPVAQQASLPPVAPSIDASQPQQQAPNITIAPTRPVTPLGAPSSGTPQAQNPAPVGLSPEVHDAIVRGLASGDPQAVALANQVLKRYAQPAYDIKNLSDGSVVAINKNNPNDAHAVYHAGGAPDDTVNQVAKGIQNGDQPPVLTGLYKLSGPVRAQLERSGFSLANADLEWKRAQKQIASLNGPQMTRFVGLANSVTNTIDEANRLADKLQLSGIPALNHAELTVYAQANGNSENGQLVTRYLTTVNTLKEEFANLAQGGYAPTEAAWGLANKQINENFGVKQLGASLDEVQRLVKYRLHAVPNFDTLGPGASNRYFGTSAGAPRGQGAPTASGSANGAGAASPPSPGHYRFDPATGKLESVQ